MIISVSIIHGLKPHRQYKFWLLTFSLSLTLSHYIYLYMPSLLYIFTCQNTIGINTWFRQIVVLLIFNFPLSLPSGVIQKRKVILFCLLLSSSLRVCVSSMYTLCYVSAYLVVSTQSTYLQNKTKTKTEYELLLFFFLIQVQARDYGFDLL